jgi:hypothetical protein
MYDQPLSRIIRDARACVATCTEAEIKTMLPWVAVLATELHDHKNSGDRAVTISRDENHEVAS